MHERDLKMLASYKEETIENEAGKKKKKKLLHGRNPDPSEESQEGRSPATSKIRGKIGILTKSGREM